MTKEESRAVGFIGLVIALSVLARAADRPEPIDPGAGSVDLAALEAASRAAGGEEDVRPLRPGEKLDPNTASAKDLARLPRGRGLAEKIIADRSANGSYRSVQDLDRVPGIGPSTLEAWKQLLTLPWSVEPAVATVPDAAPRGPTGDRRIDPNRATAQELEALPGIGPALAGRIVEWRARHGPFRTAADLEKVPGIGPALLERLRPHLRL